MKAATVSGTNTMSPQTKKIFLRRFSKLTCIATLMLIYVGGLVTSTGSGLSVPDWPLSYGMLFPPMVGGVFFEHGHRMVATVVGFLMLCLVISLHYLEDKDKGWIKKLSLAALGAVILQGVLGGITVSFYLPTAISVSHGVLAQTFFVLTIILAYSESTERKERLAAEQNSKHTAFLRACLILMILIYAQLILGAIMRHTASGLAIPDFPTMGGEWFPRFDHKMLVWINVQRFDMNLDPVTMNQIIIHFLHRLGALLLTVWVIYLNVLASRHCKNNTLINRSLKSFNLVFIAQIILGMTTVLTAKEPYITSLHVVTGAGLLGLATLLCLRASPLSWLHFKKVIQTPQLA